MIIGMDFGTTNSGVAVYDGRAVRLLPIDAGSQDPGVMRTALYISNDQTATAGQAAISLYLQQNLGRPVRMERVWVGEIEAVYADMFFVRDVYAWTDVLSPGRLMLSFKTGLHSVDYQGTTIGGSFFFLEDLISLYLHLVRVRVEGLLGQEVRQVVLGRPVRYALDPKEDIVAQERFVQAALRAGFEEVYLEREPIAAALHYETTVASEQNVLVFDFGGGTLDLTVMHIGSPGSRQVLSTGGLPIAGDVFDQRLARARLPRHFGEGTSLDLGSQPTPVPAWIYDSFSDWQELFQLQTPDKLRLLRELTQAAASPGKLQALTALVTNNYGLRMFNAVEAAKRALSDEDRTVIGIHGPGFDVDEPVTRPEFEAVIAAEIEAVEGLIDRTVRDSGLTCGQIDAVIRTGGSSQIPVFRQMLHRKFGPDRVRSLDVFSSVASGLGILAHGIEAGEVRADAFTPAQPCHASQTFSHAGVPSVNLDVMLERIKVGQTTRAGASTQATSLGLLWLGRENRLAVASAPRPLATSSIPILLRDCLPGAAGQPLAAVAADLDEPLLMVTSRYRFLLVALRQLLAAQSRGLSLDALQRLSPGEEFCTVHRWAAVRDHTRLVVVTRPGAARWYDLRRLRPTIEGSVPFQLDLPSAGWPVTILGAEPDDDLVAITTAGRVARLPVSLLSLQETRLLALAKGSDERLASVLATARGDQAFIITREGMARRVAVASIPAASAAGGPGRSVVASGEVRGVAILRAYTRGSVLAVTSSRLVPLRPYLTPLDETTARKPHPCLDLQPGEQVTALLTVPGELGLPA